MWVSLLALAHSRARRTYRTYCVRARQGEWREGDSTQKRLRREEAIAKRLKSKITGKLVYVFAELPICNSGMRFAWSFRCGYSHPIHFSVHIVKSCRWTEEEKHAQLITRSLRCSQFTYSSVCSPRPRFLPTILRLPTAIPLLSLSLLSQVERFTLATVTFI